MDRDREYELHLQKWEENNKRPPIIIPLNGKITREYLQGKSMSELAEEHDTKVTGICSKVHRCISKLNRSGSGRVDFAEEALRDNKEKWIELLDWAEVSIVYLQKDAIAIIQETIPEFTQGVLWRWRRSGKIPPFNRFTPEDIKLVIELWHTESAVCKHCGK